MSISLPNTFGLHCEAGSFTAVPDEAGLTACLETNAREARPLLVLGSGSNVLFLDERLEADVLKPDMRSIEFEPCDADRVRMRAGAGVEWHALVMQTLELGWQGLENLALIPGTVGAAPVQNIGAYGVELCDVLHSVQVFDRSSGTFRVLDNAELEFGYRDSLLKRAGARYVVVSVTLELQRHGPLHSSYDALRQLLPAEAGPYSARQIADAVVQVRRSKLPDPAVLGNAGSFFKNPLVSADCFAQLQQRWGALPAYPQADGRVKLAAGWLIERAGLKGWRRGDAATHERQALVIVNHGKASGREIVALAREVRDKVQAQFEVELVPEVRILDRRADEVPL